MPRMQSCGLLGLCERGYVCHQKCFVGLPCFQKSATLHRCRWNIIWFCTFIKYKHLSYFLPLLSANHSSILPHFIQPSISWSTSWSYCFKIHVQYSFNVICKIYNTGLPTLIVTPLLMHHFCTVDFRQQMFTLYNILMRSYIFTGMCPWIQVFWKVILCHHKSDSQHSEGTRYLHLQGSGSARSTTFQRSYDPLKRLASLTEQVSHPWRLESTQHS